MKSKKILIFSIIILLICTCTESNFDGVDETTKWFQGGNNAGDKKEYDKAIECYQKAIEIDPDYGGAYKGMGTAYFYKENYEKAIECYQKAVDIDPEDAGAYNNMGLAYSNKGNDDKAIECYQKAIEIDPDYAAAYYNMGLAYSNKGNHDKAIECYQKAIEIDPDLAAAYYNMGNLNYRKRKKTTAADNWYQAGLLYLEQNNRQLVLQTIDAMKNFVPESPLIQKLMDKLYKE